MTLLGMFARYWQPGAVKTRLAATIGAESASRFCRASVETLAERFGAAADQRQLVVTPPSSVDDFLCFAPPWSVVPQTEGHLGQRMAAFFASADAAGADRVVLIGSDSPTLPPGYVAWALERLVDVPVVLGPATDGGYYLIGCRSPAPDLFEGIAWSTPQVYQQTIQRLEDLRIDHERLPAWYDVDDLPSLLMLHNELQSESVERGTDRLRDVVAAIVASLPHETIQAAIHSTHPLMTIQSVAGGSSGRTI